MQNLQPVYIKLIARYLGPVDLGNFRLACKKFSLAKAVKIYRFTVYCRIKERMRDFIFYAENRLIKLVAADGKTFVHESEYWGECGKSSDDDYCHILEHKVKILPDCRYGESAYMLNYIKLEDILEWKEWTVTRKDGSGYTVFKCQKVGLSLKKNF